MFVSIDRSWNCTMKFLTLLLKSEELVQDIFFAFVGFILSNRSQIFNLS